MECPTLPLLRATALSVATAAIAVASTDALLGQALDLELDDFPTVSASDFRVTEFASGLNFPYGMTSLSDGSLLVAHSKSTSGFMNSTGELLRLVDTDKDGVADSSTTVYSGLSGSLTGLERSGNYIFATSAASGSESIHVLKTGTSHAEPLTSIGSVEFSFPTKPDGTTPSEHKSYALAVRQAGPSTHEVFFNLGSVNNDASTSDTVVLSGLLSGNADVESIYRFQLSEQSDDSIQLGSMEKIASGLRNAAGIAFDPNTGDLLFQDNGIDTPDNRSVALSADELNRIDLTEIGGTVEDFGFADTYIRYSNGEKVGSSGIDPLFAFTPLDGDENEGATEIAFAPEEFPEALRNGVFIGFHGQWNDSGPTNEENPLVFADLNTGEYHHIVGVDHLGIGHLNGLHSTKDALYVADMTGTGSLNGGGTGAIYQITVVPETSTLLAILTLCPLIALRAKRSFFKNQRGCS